MRRAGRRRDRPGRSGAFGVEAVRRAAVPASSATASVVGASVVSVSGCSTPSRASIAASRRPKPSVDTPPRKVTGAPSRPIVRAALNGPPPGCARTAPSSVQHQVEQGLAGHDDRHAADDPSRPPRRIAEDVQLLGRTKSTIDRIAADLTNLDRLMSDQGRVWMLSERGRERELVFAFEFDEDLNEAVKELPRRWFDWRRKHWRVPADPRSAQAVQELLGRFPALQPDAEVLSWLSDSDKLARPGDRAGARGRRGVRGPDADRRRARGADRRRDRGDRGPARAAVQPRRRAAGDAAGGHRSGLAGHRLRARDPRGRRAGGRGAERGGRRGRRADADAGHDLGPRARA